jgi:hypothetical protein
MPSHVACYVAPKTYSEYGKNSVAAQNILGRCAEQTQNINGICRNISGIFKNINGISENINDILSFLCAMGEFFQRIERVYTLFQQTFRCSAGVVRMWNEGDKYGLRRARKWGKLVPKVHFLLIFSG